LAGADPQALVARTGATGVGDLAAGEHDHPDHAAIGPAAMVGRTDRAVVRWRAFLVIHSR
jgi:hypothetical protein